MDVTTNFLDIPMDGLADVNELDDHLSQAIEKVSDPIAWWWDHRKVYPKLSAMAFDYLSVLGKFPLLFCIETSLMEDLATSTAVERLFSQGRQLLHFTRNRLSPSMIRAFLCLGDWGKKDLVDMPELVSAIRASRLGM
jgi:hypothetical protein